MTPAERRALAFFAAVGALGVGARAAGLGAPPPLALPGDGAAAERRALAAQLDAVDSARAHRQAGRARGKRARTPRAPGAGRRAAVTPDTAGSGWPTGTWGVPLTGAAGRADTGPRAVVDVDRADSAAFEQLPGVGPALARRLVADRVRRGPFGSMAGLSRVPGVGPALEARLAPFVTFSGRPASP